ATLVKLSKVLMLVPLLMVLGLTRRRRDAAAKLPPVPFPWFIAAFVGVMLLNSVFTLHPQLRQIILDADQFAFMMVMVALGLTTRLFHLRQGGQGWRLVGAGIVGLLLSSLVAYGLVAPLARAADAAPSSAESAMLASASGRLFSSVGCAKCHVPALQGRKGPVTL